MQGALGHFLMRKLSLMFNEVGSETHGAFIIERSILHFFIVFKYVKIWSKCTEEAKTKCCTLKADVQKDYDTVEWGFLQKLLIGLRGCLVEGNRERELESLFPLVVVWYAFF